MNIYIGCDHAGYDLSIVIMQHLLTNPEYHSYNINHVGCDNAQQSSDYPIYAKRVCTEISSDNNACGILVCGSGIGMNIAANRHGHIRSAVIHTTQQAQLARAHNNINVMCLAARELMDFTHVTSLLAIFLCDEFDAGRHQKRLDLI